MNLIYLMSKDGSNWTKLNGLLYVVSELKNATGWGIKVSKEFTDNVRDFPNRIIGVNYDFNDVLFFQSIIDFQYGSILKDTKTGMYCTYAGNPNSSFGSTCMVEYIGNQKPQIVMRSNLVVFADETSDIAKQFMSVHRNIITLDP